MRGMLYAVFHKTPVNTRCNEFCVHPEPDTRPNVTSAGYTLLKIACLCQNVCAFVT